MSFQILISRPTILHPSIVLIIFPYMRVTHPLVYIEQHSQLHHRASTIVSFVKLYAAYLSFINRSQSCIKLVLRVLSVALYFLTISVSFQSLAYPSKSITFWSISNLNLLRIKLFDPPLFSLKYTQHANLKKSIYTLRQCRNKRASDYRWRRRILDRGLKDLIVKKRKVDFLDLEFPNRMRTKPRSYGISPTETWSRA